MLERWRRRARVLREEVHALFLACRDPRVPWAAKVVLALIVAYAASPLDLIPDPIPILGYLDDLVLLPLGVLLARRLIPPDVLADCRARARAAPRGLPTSRLAAVVIVGIWVLVALGLLRLLGLV